MNDIFESIEKEDPNDKNVAQKHRKIWHTIFFTNECKAVIQLVDFKSKMKTQVPEKCP